MWVSLIAKQKVAEGHRRRRVAAVGGRGAWQERREAPLLVAVVEGASPEHRRELREEASSARGDLRVGRVRVAVDQERDRAHASRDERGSCKHGASP